MLANLQGLKKFFKQYNAGMGGDGAELPACCRLFESRHVFLSLICLDLEVLERDTSFRVNYVRQEVSVR
jgi:hypothetical protein